MVKVNRVLMAIAAMVLSLALTGCGKDKYDGTYTGYEIRTQSSTAMPNQPQSPGNTGYNAPPRTVTLTLANNGDVVTGTYSVTANAGAYGNTGYPGTGYPGNTGYPNTSYTAGTETYQFTGSSATSGEVTNVALISTGTSYSQYSNCLMQGTLTSQNHGQTMSGTLSAGNAGASNCGSLQLSLTRSN